MLLLLQLIFCREAVKIYGNVQENMYEDNSLDINMLSGKDTEHIVIEHEGREFKVKNEDESKVKEILKLLKNEAAPTDLEKIIKQLESMESESYSEKLMKGKISFCVFFVENFIEVNESEMKVFLSTDKKLAESLGIPFPGYFGFNATENVTYKKEFKSVGEAIAVISTPILSSVSQDTLKFYEESGLPAFYLFYKNFNLKELYSYAKSLREKIKFGLIPFDEEKTNMKYFGIGSDNLPAIIYVEENKKYKNINVDLEGIKKFVHDYFNQKLIPFENSGEAPADNKDRGVKIVVRNEWNKFKEMKEKDRILVFHSPYCTFCVQLMPILEKIADKMDKSKVEIGTINMLENDMPEYKIKYFPTIMMIKANSNEEIMYESTDRSEKALVEFISKGENKVKIEVEENGEKKEVEEKKVNSVKSDL